MTPRARGHSWRCSPETFVPLYPSNAWARQAAAFSGSDELWERLWQNSVDVPGPLVDQLVDACRAHDIHVAIGVNERESERPGSLYNTLLLLGPGGIELKHRKLVPTHQERLFLPSARATTSAWRTPARPYRWARVLGEPHAARARAVFRHGPQISIAPTADDSDGWLATVRHIAIESGRSSSRPRSTSRAPRSRRTFPLELPDHEVFGRGGSGDRRAHRGEVIAGPLYDQEGMVIADCDLRRGLHAKRWFDAVGHYSGEAALGMMKDGEAEADSWTPPVSGESVLVTGGSGFIGSHCILDLLRAGYRVRTTVRSPDREATVGELLGAESADALSFAVADLTDDDGWADAVGGCDFVLHVASPFPLGPPKHEDDLIVPAREGALRVLAAARDAKVKRVVMTSSFAAIGYGLPPMDRPFTEEDWTDPDGDGVSAYAKSKTLAERAAWEFVEREGDGLELSVVNPVGVFGPVLGSDFSTSIELVKRLLDGAMPGIPGLRSASSTSATSRTCTCAR